MKNKIILWFTFLLFLNSCSSQNDSKVVINLKFEDFEQSKHLVGKKYLYDSILNPRNVLIKNNFLVVSTQGTGNLLHLINLKNLEYIQSKGIQGQGPGEISSMIWELDRGIDQNTFWAYDLNSKTNHEFEINSDSKYPIKSIKQRQDWFMGFSIHLIEKNKFISYVTRDNFKFGIFDSTGNRISSFGPWSDEKVTDEKTGYLLLGLNQGPIDFNSKNKTLVHSRLNFELLEISNLETGKIISIYGPKNYEVKYEIFDSNGFPSADVDSDIPMGYSDIFVGKNSVFAVYIGKPNSLINSSKEISKSIFEFSLQGKPLSHFTTNYSIRSIAVDEEAKKIYTITEDKDPGLAVFEY